MNAIQSAVDSREPPQVLVSIGRQVHDGTVTRITVCGQKSIYNDIIRLAGGENAYKGLAAYPRVSAEGILAIDPDVIVDLVPDLHERGWKAGDLQAEWASLPRVSAVRNQRGIEFLCDIGDAEVAEPLAQCRAGTGLANGFSERVGKID